MIHSDGFYTALICSLLMCACAVSSKNIVSADEDNESTLSRSFFSQQVVCSAIWGELMNEWHASGGGLKKSIILTRREIEDNPSRFAVAVRNVWEQAGDYLNENKQIGYWPVAKSAELDLGLLLEKELSGHIRSDCGSLVWLNSHIWDELYAVVNGKIVARKLEETPDEIVWDSNMAPRWVLYWLLVPL